MTLLSLASNVSLTIIKGLAGWFLHSASLLADAGHSLSIMGNRTLPFGGFVSSSHVCRRQTLGGFQPSRSSPKPDPKWLANGPHLPLTAKCIIVIMTLRVPRAWATTDLVEIRQVFAYGKRGNCLRIRQTGGRAVVQVAS
ncbi:hypothetical protein BDZ89DRAFT_1109268 [Hymenopellis radicata]|nr:hypothetical protein BDZ89DRAFT_1109268 [Hymenopellis radicata]